MIQARRVDASEQKQTTMVVMEKSGDGRENEATFNIVEQERYFIGVPWW